MTRLNPRDDDEEMRRVSRYMRMVRAKGLNNEIGVRMIGYDAMRVASSVLRGFLQSRVLEVLRFCNVVPAKSPRPEFLEDPKVDSQKMGIALTAAPMRSRLLSSAEQAAL